MIFWSTGKQIDKIGREMNCQNMNRWCFRKKNQQSNWSESFELIFIVIMCRFVFGEELCNSWNVFCYIYFFDDKMHSSLSIPNGFKQLSKRIQPVKLLRTL